MKDKYLKTVNLVKTNTFNLIPPSNNTIVCKADTGATKNYFTEKDSNILLNLKKVKNGPKVQLPNKMVLPTIFSGNIPLHPLLSNNATKAHIIKGLTNASLISIGQLCDNNCIAIFDKHDLKIFQNKILVLSGKRNQNDGLWDINIQNTNPTSTQQVNFIIQKSKTKYDLAEYLHKCAFSPSISTFSKAIKTAISSLGPVLLPLISKL